MTSLKSLQYYKDLIVVLTQKELKVRYKRSFLGYLWSIANPLALAVVFYVAFKVVMRIQIENYTLFLISGLFPWQWFSNSVSSSSMVFVSNAALIKKVNFPCESLIIATVLNDMLHFILSVPVIVIFLFFYGLKPNLSWVVGIPVLLVIQFMVTFGFSVAISTINLFFRDIERIVSILLILIFYFTPIIYSGEMIPAKYKTLILLNPLAVLMLSWRDLFMKGILNFGSIAVSFLYSLIVLFMGYLIFRRLRWKFAEVL
jgi:lipopolysaccharide transport system permease protein